MRVLDVILNYVSYDKKVVSVMSHVASNLAPRINR